MLNISLTDFYKTFGNIYDLRIQLHDAMYGECPPTLVKDCIRAMRKAMIYPVNIEFEEMYIYADFSVGRNWGEMKELDIDWRDDPQEGTILKEIEI